MKISNSFLEGINLDVSDLVIKNTMLRLAQNIRLVDLDSSSYAVTTIRGTELGFHLTSGFLPITAKQFDNVMYILSINPSTSQVELGSFGSPDYINDDPAEQEIYRPFNNLEFDVTSPDPVDDHNPGNWSQTGSNSAWTFLAGNPFGGNYARNFMGPGLPHDTNVLFRNITALAGTPYQVRYVGVLDGVATSLTVLSYSTSYKFYDAGHNLLYTKTFSATAIGPIPFDLTETVTLPVAATRVEITSTVDSPSNPVALFEVHHFEMTPPTVGERGPFRTTLFGYTLDSFVKMELQPEYDGSINVILIERNNPPRIINSTFLRNELGLLEVAPDRPGTANTNTYTVDSLEQETKLILSTDIILGIALSGIVTGGKLKYGSYRYYFAYMTQDFNTTEIVGQSGLCAAFSGVDFNTLKGGTSGQETDKKVVLTLSNLDTNFRYLKVYVLYSSGQEGLQEQMLEFVVPTEITGSTMTFYHTGFEETLEIDQDVVNTNFQIIDSAASGTQVNGFLFLAGIRETTIDYTDFRAAALEVKAQDKSVTLPYSSSTSTLGGYANSVNIYNYVGLFGGEAYAYRIVFILPGGRLTPPFPVKGRDSAPTASGGAVLNDDGIYRAPLSNLNTFFDGSNFIVRGVTFNLATVPSDIKEASVGFFIVRAERNPNLITQGYFFPVMRVPPIDFRDSNSTYYNRFQAGTESLYKMVPCVDSMIEAFEFDVGGGGGDLYVVDGNNKLQAYMPIVINHFGPGSNDGQVALAGSDNIPAYINNFPQDHWAFLSADSLGNEPEMISKIAQRQGMVCAQLGKVSFYVTGQLAPLPGIDHGGTAQIGMLYDAQSIAMYSGSPAPAIQTIDLSEYVPAESFATGSVFSSKVVTRFKVANPTGGQAFGVSLAYNSYFGMKVSNLNDITYSTTNPQGGNSRIPSANFVVSQESSYFGYSNYLTSVNAGFLVNVYPNGGIDLGTGNLIAVASLYPDTDSLVYKQVGKRYTWADAGASIDIFDGDCYTVRVFHKLYQSGIRDPFSPLSILNIDAGQVVSLIHQSRFNTNLRNPIRYDASEFQDRSFFPYQSKGDFLAFRRYRYPESIAYSPGFSPDLGPKVYTPISSLAPSIRSDFFSRISGSAKHIPNAFQNGYRNFTANNFRDYDSSMGRIVDVVNHRGLLLTIFEHGIGLMPIEERILTGQDSAGPVYALPSTVLPATMSFISRQIGSQNPRSIVQTPSAVYGIDVEKRKIWQFRDKLEIISDAQVASFIDTNNLGAHPRSGYDFKYNEVLFTIDYWTLCFREGVEKFTSLYSFVPRLYAARGGDFYEFADSGGLAGYPNFQKMDSPTNMTINDMSPPCYIEFTVPVIIGADGKPQVNVYDYIEIFSNEVTPSKVEFFTYTDKSVRRTSIDTGEVHQYSHVNNTTDFFKEESPISWREKRFVVQIPATEQFRPSTNIPPEGWGVGGRMRNKYLIVRLTYGGQAWLQLTNVITTFRASKS